ncbi:MAG: acyltransferase [Oscillospiraceae bacterium]|jgi:peptidoglycan/LPS O-acetylase OafA/YrhL|nr:acyltransferase [Oscillospiraceae bacterium]
MTKIRWFSVVRTFGLLLVLIYHLFPAVLPGGFFGVDVFFVFSGYLITALVLSEFGESGGFDFPAYAKRRLARIVPPLVCTVLLTLPFALLISPDFTADISRQSAGALGFVTNYYEIANGGSYEALLLPHLFIHTWSLAVEMHFYAVWGAAALLTVIIAKKTTGENRLRTLKIALFLLAALAAAASYMHMRTLSAAVGEHSAAYMSSLSHAFPFFVGAAAATVFGARLSRKTEKALYGKPCAVISAVILAASAAGIALFAGLLDFGDAETFRYGFAAVSVLAAVMIAAARALHSAVPDSVREPRLLKLTADLSYGIYLFHWPLFIAFSNAFKSRFAAASFTLLASVLGAAFTQFIVEPLLRRRRMPSRRTLGYAASALLCAGAILSAVVISRAPETTSIDANLFIENIYQDADKIESLARLADAVNFEPVDTAAFPQRPGIADGADSGGVFEPPDTSQEYDDILPGVTVVGDSLVLGVRKSLIEAIENCDVDGETSRQFPAGADLILELQKSGSLREYVVVALGVNGSRKWKQSIQTIIDGLEPGHKLIFLTPFDGRNGRTVPGEVSEYERTLPELYDFVTVADWAAAIADKTELLRSDLVHIPGAGKAMDIFTDCVLDAIEEASQKPAKRAP